MRFYLRFSLGLLLGVLAGGASAFFVHKWWVVALIAAFVAMIGFLATFFIWDADRAPTPAEPAGYEQVLFDNRNLAHLAILAVVLAGATYGLNAYADQQAGPGIDPAAAELDTAYGELVALSDAFNAANGAFASGGDVGDLQSRIDEAEGVRLAASALDVTPSLEARKAAIEDAAAFFGAAFSELRTCANAGTSPCIEARIAQASAVQALETYAST